jgi:hypothetical protein
VRVRYQACDDSACLPPKTETFQLSLKREPVDMPNLSFHGDTGQWKSPLDGAPHMRRLVLRQLRRHPLGVLRSVLQMARLGREARRRTRGD